MTATPDMPAISETSTGFIATGRKAAIGVRGGQFVVAPLQRSTGRFDVENGTRYPLNEAGWSQAWFSFGYLDAKAAAEYADAVSGRPQVAPAAPVLNGCPNGHPNTEGAAFCSTCGAAIGTPRCPNGHELEPNAQFCTVCGSSAVPPKPAYSAAPYPAAYGSRRPPPGTGIVWAITICFGVFGVIPAAIQANAARQDGYPTDPYWKAFWIPVIVVTIIWIAIFASVVSSSHSAFDDCYSYSYSDC